MSPRMKLGWTGVAVFLFVGIFATYQQNESARLEATPTPQVTQSAPTVSSSPTAQPSVPAKPKPASTVTTTVTAPPSDACKNAAELALQMKDAVYETSTQFGEMRSTMDSAVRAMGMHDQAKLSKQLGKLQKQDDDLSAPARQVTELEPQLKRALEECKNS